MYLTFIQNLHYLQYSDILVHSSVVFELNKYNTWKDCLNMISVLQLIYTDLLIPRSLARIIWYLSKFWTQKIYHTKVSFTCCLNISYQISIRTYSNYCCFKVQNTVHVRYTKLNELISIEYIILIKSLF